MNNQDNNIEHPGIIEKIENGRIWVSIQPQSACGNCHSKSYCGMAEVAEKIIEVEGNDKQTFSPGQKVTVALRKSLGYKALFLGYLLPLLILLFILVVSLHFSGNELFSAILSLAGIVPYYIFIYLKREKVRSSFRFFIKS